MEPVTVVGPFEKARLHPCDEDGRHDDDESVEEGMDGHLLVREERDLSETYGYAASYRRFRPFPAATPQQSRDAGRVIRTTLARLWPAARCRLASDLHAGVPSLAPIIGHRSRTVAANYLSSAATRRCGAGTSLEIRRLSSAHDPRTRFPSRPRATRSNPIGCLPTFARPSLRSRPRSPSMGSLVSSTSMEIPPRWSSALGAPPGQGRKASPRGHERPPA